jgi:S-DNA-T family DNA segregation ATPase FtsK/SpoIIIE
MERLIEFWKDWQQAVEQAPLFPPWTEDEVERQADSKLQDAIEVSQGRDTISTSFIKRQLRIGFPRAARLIDQMEEQGFVGPDEGGGRGRRVLIGADLDLDEIDERLPGVGPS